MIQMTDKESDIFATGDDDDDVCHIQTMTKLRVRISCLEIGQQVFD